jgi:hypothetical protein
VGDGTCVCVCVRGEGVASPLNRTKSFIEERTNGTRCLKVNVKRIDESRSVGLARLHRRVHAQDRRGTRAQETDSTAIMCVRSWSSDSVRM